MGGLREIFRYAAIVSGNNILTSVVNFVAFLVTIKALGTYGFGLYTLAMSVLSFAIIFLDLGLGKVIVSDVAKDLSEGRKGEASGLFRGYILVQALLTAAIFVSLVFFTGNIS